MQQRRLDRLVRRQYNGAVTQRERTPAIIYHPLFLGHDTGEHVESATRLSTLEQALRGSGWWRRDAVLAPSSAPLEWLQRVHAPSYIASVERLCSRGGGFLDLDTVVSPGSYRAAFLAAGSGLLAVDLLLASEPRPSFALVRPPGHHAERAKAMGFCLFNNIAVAATYALERYGCERLLIVDFDVHHGNGTQDAFYGDGRVLYFSTHESPLYPGTGRLAETGEGAGAGANFNLPLPAGVGDAGHLLAFQEVLLPAARRFRPQLILVSAGYDGHWRDPLAQMALTITGYGQLVGTLRDLAAELCDGRLALFLEGGYDLQALAQGVVGSLDALAGRPVQDSLGPAPWRAGEPNVASIVAPARRLHAL